MRIDRSPQKPLSRRNGYRADSTPHGMERVYWSAKIRIVVFVAIKMIADNSLHVKCLFVTKDWSREMVVASRVMRIFLSGSMRCGFSRFRFSDELVVENLQNFRIIFVKTLDN